MQKVRRERLQKLRNATGILDIGEIFRMHLSNAQLTAMKNLQATVDAHKKKIISRMQGYHGVTIASASLTGKPNNH